MMAGLLVFFGLMFFVIFSGLLCEAICTNAKLPQMIGFLFGILATGGLVIFILGVISRVIEHIEKITP